MAQPQEESNASASAAVDDLDMSSWQCTMPELENFSFPSYTTSSLRRSLSEPPMNWSNPEYEDDPVLPPFPSAHTPILHRDGVSLGQNITDQAGLLPKRKRQQMSSTQADAKKRRKPGLGHHAGYHGDTAYRPHAGYTSQPQSEIQQRYGLRSRPVQAEGQHLLGHQMHRNGTVELAHGPEAGSAPLQLTVSAADLIAMIKQAVHETLRESGLCA